MHQDIHTPAARAEIQKAHSGGSRHAFRQTDALQQFCLAGLFWLTVVLDAAGQTPGTKLWEFTAGGPIYTSPALGADGTVYFGADDRKLYAVRPGGALLWTFTTGAEIRSSPAVGLDGTIYFGSQDDRLYAMKPDGTVRWSFTTGGDVQSTPAIGRDGTIYFGSRSGTFYALNPNGTLKWSLVTGPFITASPAIGTNGTIYFGSGDGNLYALNPNGTIQWTFGEGNGWLGSPALGSDGTVYVGGLGRRLYAVNGSGVKLWEHQAGSIIWSAPVFGPDGTIYFNTDSTYLYALNPNGTRRWLLEPDYSPYQSPAIDALGNIYTSAEGAFYAVTNHGTNGSALWSIFPVGVPYASPLLDSRGVLYFTTSASQGRLYAYQAAAGLAATAWPMHHRDTRRTGALPAGQPPLVNLLQPLDGSILPSVSTLSAAATDPDGTVTKVEFFASGNKVGEALASPYAVAWTNTSNGKHIITAVATDHQSNATVSAAATVFVMIPGALTTLIPAGSSWKYLDDGSDQGAVWREPDFNDSAWLSGLAQLGYGDGDESTVIRSNRSNGTRILTSYFRHAANVPDHSVVTNFAVRLRRDDGAVVYVNGVEVFRSNMPAGVINYLSTASSTASDDGTNFFTAAINPGVFVPGKNVVAAEVHQFNTSSTDTSFELELLANTPLGGFPPVVGITNPVPGAVLSSGVVPLQVRTSDGDGTVSRVAYFLDSALVGVSSNAPFSFTLSNVPPGSFTLTARATDNIGFTSLSGPVTITILAGNQPPSFTPGPDQTVLEDAGPQTVVGWASAISAGAAGETNQSLAFIVTNRAPALFAIQPAMDPAGTLTFTPAANAFGTATVSVVLMDDGGTANGGTDTSAEQTFEIRVLPVDDPPVARAGEDQVLACAGASTAVLLDGSASGDVDGDPLIYAWHEGGTRLGTNAQLAIGLGAGVHFITLEVTDLTGNSAQDSLMVSVVDNAPPVITCPASRVVEAGTAWDFAEPTAADACDGTNVIVAIISTVTNSVNGCAFVATRTWEALDAAGNRARCSQTVSVVDTAPPVFACPESFTLDAATPDGATVVFTNMLASDCASDVTIASVPASGSVLPLGTNSVIWTATDVSGNSNTCEISVVVLGPRAILENVLKELVTAQPGVTNRAEQRRLRSAINHLTQATNDALWLDDRHPGPANARQVFQRGKLGASQLRNILAYRVVPRGPVALSDPLVLGWMTRLANAHRLLAEFAVDEAEKRGGDARAITSCRKLITRGDTATAAHRTPAAIAQYQEAWRRAEKVQPRR